MEIGVPAAVRDQVNKEQSMPQLIGVPRETAPGEKRVATVPDVVEKLVKLGFHVAVQPGAGDPANFADDTRCSRRIKGESSTRAAAPAACSCSQRSSSKHTADAWVISAYSGRNQTLPHGNSPR